MAGKVTLSAKLQFSGVAATSGIIHQAKRSEELQSLAEVQIKKNSRRKLQRKKRFSAGD